MFVIPSAFDAIYELADGARRQVELRGRLIDYIGNDLEYRASRVGGLCGCISAEYFFEHLALILSHARQRSSRQHSRHDHGGAFLADPEARCRRIGHSRENVRHDDMAHLGQFGAICTHKVGISFVCKIEDTSVVLHESKDMAMCHKR